MDTAATRVLLPLWAGIALKLNVDGQPGCTGKGVGGAGYDYWTREVGVLFAGEDSGVFMWDGEVAFTNVGLMPVVGWIGFLEYFDFEFKQNPAQMAFMSNSTFPGYYRDA